MMNDAQWLGCLPMQADPGTDIAADVSFARERLS